MYSKMFENLDSVLKRKKLSFIVMMIFDMVTSMMGKETIKKI